MANSLAIRNVLPVFLLLLIGCGTRTTQTSNLPSCQPAFNNESDMTSLVLMQDWQKAQQEFVTKPGVCLNELQISNYSQCHWYMSAAALNVWPCQQTVESVPDLGVIGMVDPSGNIILDEAPIGDADASYEMVNVILRALGVPHSR